MIPLPASIKDYMLAGLAALVVLLALNTWLDLHIGPVGFEGWKPKAQRHELETKQCEARHAITRQSVDTLQAEIEANNEQARQRNATYENSLRIARERAEVNERKATASNARIARLEALAGQDGVCQVPDDLLAELEGL